VKRKNVLILFALVVLSVGPSANADLVRLNDGTRYEGEIVEENDDSIRIRLDAGGGAAYATVKREEILRIIRDTPEERQRKEEERKRAQGLVKDGDEWVTEQVKADREAQRKAEETRKMQQRLKYKLEMDQIKEEQKQLQEADEAFGESLDRSGERMVGDLRSVLFRFAFFVVLAIIAFVLLKRYFWD